MGQQSQDLELESWPQPRLYRETRIRGTELEGASELSEANTEHLQLLWEEGVGRGWKVRL